MYALLTQNDQATTETKGEPFCRDRNPKTICERFSTSQSRPGQEHNRLSDCTNDPEVRFASLPSVPCLKHQRTRCATYIRSGSVRATAPRHATIYHIQIFTQTMVYLGRILVVLFMLGGVINNNAVAAEVSSSSADTVHSSPIQLRRLRRRRGRRRGSRHRGKRSKGKKHDRKSRHSSSRHVRGTKGNTAAQSPSSLMNLMTIPVQYSTLSHYLGQDVLRPNSY